MYLRNANDQAKWNYLRHIELVLEHSMATTTEVEETIVRARNMKLCARQITIAPHIIALCRS